MRLLKLGVATLFGVLVPFVGCGDSGKSSISTADGGHGSGAGESSGGAADIPDPVRCGFATCQAIILPGGAVAPCCADPLGGICGAALDTAALGLPTAMSCQPLTQAGKLDLTCPSSAGAVAGGLPLPALPGCCRATGQCGYLMTDLGGLLPFAPGCIDAAPFLNGEDPLSCGPGAAPGGAAGAGGVPGGGGVPGAGGDEQGGAPGKAGEASAAADAGFGGNGSTP